MENAGDSNSAQGETAPVLEGAQDGFDSLDESEQSVELTDVEMYEPEEGEGEEDEDEEEEEEEAEEDEEEEEQSEEPDGEQEEGVMDLEVHLEDISSSSSTASDLSVMNISELLPSPVGASHTPSPPSSRYSSWAAVVVGDQNLDENGQVVADSAPAAAAGSRRAVPSLLPNPELITWPFVAPVPVRGCHRPMLRMPSSHTTSASTSGSISISLTPSPPPPAPERKEAIRLMHLPNEVLDLILRYTTNRPRMRQPLWDTFESQKDAMSFALTCTRMCALFRQRIVAIRTKPERFRDDVVYGVAQAGIVVEVRSPRDVDHLGAVLRLAGPFLRELLVTRGLARRNWVESFCENVGEVKKLSVRDVNGEYPLERMLEKVWWSLEELEIVGATGQALSESQLRAMGRFCGGVKKMSLRLSMFEHDWQGVWMGIGPGLKRLSLGATRFWIMDEEEEGLLEMIGRYCVDLRELHFYHVGPALGNGCVKLIRRLKWLERVELEQCQVGRSELEGIREWGGKVWICHGSSLISHGYNMDCVEVLGDRMEVLRYRSQLAHDESVGMVGDKCAQLKELRLDCASTIEKSVLEELLRKRGHMLEGLSMSFFVRGVERATIGDTLSVLGDVAHGLKELHVGGGVFEVEAFGRVIGNCKETLQKVSVTFGYRAGGDSQTVDEALLIGIAQCVSTCTNVYSLVVTDRTGGHSGESTAVKKAVRRMNAERISICGVEYAA